MMRAIVIQCFLGYYPSSTSQAVVHDLNSLREDSNMFFDIMRSLDAHLQNY